MDQAGAPLWLVCSLCKARPQPATAKKLGGAVQPRKRKRAETTPDLVYFSFTRCSLNTENLHLNFHTPIPGYIYSTFICTFPCLAADKCLTSGKICPPQAHLRSPPLSPLVLVASSTRGARYSWSVLSNTPFPRTETLLMSNVRHLLN